MYKSVNVKDFGARANGRNDDADAFQSALDSGANEIIVPIGEYKIGHTLRIGSDTRISAHPYAHIKLANHACTKRGDFLMCNKGHNNTNGERDRNIVIHGGIWDGNNKTNAKPKEMRKPDGNSGAIFSFKNVDNITLSTLVMSEAGGYHARFCKMSNFLIENINFRSFHPVVNNDGIHLNGFCENGIIRNLRSDTPGTPSDDMVAFNADDIFDRCEALDFEGGYIRNVVVDGLYAEKCQSFVRLLSVYSDITNLSISNVSGGFWGMAVNMDGARYCMTPIVDPNSKEYREGIGHIENVHLKHFKVHNLGNLDNSFYIRLESNMKDFTIEDFVREDELELRHDSTTLRIMNISPSKITIKGATDKKSLEKFVCENEGTITQTENEYKNTTYNSEFETKLYDSHIYNNGSFELLKIN